MSTESNHIKPVSKDIWHPWGKQGSLTYYLSYGLFLWRASLRRKTSGLKPDLEVLTTVRNDLEANPLIAALSSLGIETTRTGSFTADFRAEAPGRVSIVVKHEDLARAKEALEEIDRDSSDIDWSQVDVGKPE